MYSETSHLGSGCKGRWIPDQTPSTEQSNGRTVPQANFRMPVADDIVDGSSAPTESPAERKLKIHLLAMTKLQAELEILWNI